MRLTNKQVGKIVFNAFQQTFREKDNGNLRKNNSFRSAYFVSLIGKRLNEHFVDAKTNYQAIDSINSSGKLSGEWLYDISVTTQLKIIDERKGCGFSAINTNVLFACESEFDTSLQSFTTDFGKLICSNANQYLFIQGLNQKTSTGRRSFIDSRISIIKKTLEHLISDDFVLAFVPTPGKIGNFSFWDEHENEVASWIEIYVYDASQNEFIQLKFQSIESLSLPI
ncbi:MAG: hypothetical protein AB8G22_24310 [Saprospiraceae bacterium]